MFIDTLKDLKTTKRFGEHYGSYPVLRIHDHTGKDIGGRIDGNKVAGKIPLTQVLQQLRQATPGDEPKAVTFPSGESLSVITGPDGEGEEYFNPFASDRLPLLDVSGANRTKKLSKNFTAGELAQSGMKKFSKVRIDPNLIVCLQKIRDHVGKPVIVNSGYRSFLYNKKLYEDKNQTPTKSRHISGQAADIHVAGMSGLEIAKVALKVYGPDIGVGVAKTYAHIDVRGTYARWTYFKGEENEATIRALDAYRKTLKREDNNECR